MTESRAQATDGDPTGGETVGGVESAHGRTPIRALETGVPGLDAVLGGGLPENSFNVVAGAPGSGKTTLALQLLFANATVERPGLYFTMVGEPLIKLLRYQAQFAFFRSELVGSAVHFRNLSTEVLEGDFAVVLARITSDVERIRPSVVVIDSFRWIDSESTGHIGADLPDPARTGRMGLEEFVERLALQLTTWEVTTFLLGEYAEADVRHQLFTLADGIIWLTQAPDRNSVVRKLQVSKVRGRAHMPGLHTFRMGDAGVQIFPRIPEQQFNRKPGRRREKKRVSTGVPGLDALMGGGIPAGDAVMIAGPTGSGKTTLGMQFVINGVQTGDACVVAVFEEYPEDYLERLTSLGVDAAELIRSGLLQVIYVRPLDLSVDETLAEILAAVKRLRAARVVIDSLSGFEVALAPTFREDFRESLYRLVGALTASSVTVMMTQESLAMSPDAGVTGERVSFITDDIIVQRYVEIAGAMCKVLAVVKMRRSLHSTEFWSYSITHSGAAIGEPLTGFHGIQSGLPDAVPERTRARLTGLTSREMSVLDALVRLGEGTDVALAAQILVPLDEVEQALSRLVALGYVYRVDSAGVDVASRYRPIARKSLP